MTWRSVILEAARELPPPDLADFIGALEAAKVTAWARMLAPAPPATATETLVDAKGMSKVINRPAWSVRDMARRGAIPSIRVGRLMKFRPSAVLEALEAGPHRITEPVRAEKRRLGKGRCPTGVQVPGAPEVSRG